MNHRIEISNLLRLILLDDSERNRISKEFRLSEPAIQQHLSEQVFTLFDHQTEQLIAVKYDQFTVEYGLSKRITPPPLGKQARKAVFQDYEDVLTGRKTLDQILHRYLERSQKNKLQQIDDDLNALFGSLSGKAEILEPDEDLPQTINYEPSSLPSSNPEVYLDRGDDYYDMRRYDQAIDNYAWALALGIQDAFLLSYALIGRGLSYLGKEDVDHAITDFTRAMQTGMQKADAYYYRGLAYSKKSARRKAISDLRKVSDYTENMELRNKAHLLLTKIEREPRRWFW